MEIKSLINDELMPPSNLARIDEDSGEENEDNVDNEKIYHEKDLIFALRVQKLSNQVTHQTLDPVLSSQRQRHCLSNSRMRALEWSGEEAYAIHPRERMSITKG